MGCNHSTMPVDEHEAKIAKMGGTELHTASQMVTPPAVVATGEVAAGNELSKTSSPASAASPTATHSVSEISKVRSFDEDVHNNPDEPLVVTVKKSTNNSPSISRPPLPAPLHISAKAFNDDMYTITAFSPASPQPPHLNFQSTARRRRSADSALDDTALIPISSFVSSKSDTTEHMTPPNASTKSSPQNLRRTSLQEYNDDSSIVSLLQLKNNPPSPSKSGDASPVNMSSPTTTESQSQPPFHPDDTQLNFAQTQSVSQVKFLANTSTGRESPTLRVVSEPSLNQEEVDTDEDEDALYDFGDANPSVMRSETPKNHSFRYINPLALGNSNFREPKVGHAVSPIITSGRSARQQKPVVLQSLTDSDFSNTSPFSPVDGTQNAHKASSQLNITSSNTTKPTESTESLSSNSGPITSESAVIEFKPSKKTRLHDAASTGNIERSARDLYHSRSSSQNDLFDDTDAQSARSYSTEPDENDIRNQESKMSLLLHKPTSAAFESDMTEIVGTDLFEESIDAAFRKMQQELLPIESRNVDDTQAQRSNSSNSSDAKAPPADEMFPVHSRAGALQHSTPEPIRSHSERPHDDLIWVSRDTKSLAKKLSRFSNPETMPSARGDEHDLSFDDELESAEFSPHQKNVDARASASLYSPQDDGVVMHLQLSEDDDMMSQDEMLNHMNGYQDDFSDFEEEDDFGAVLGDDAHDLDEGFVVF